MQIKQSQSSVDYQEAIDFLEQRVELVKQGKEDELLWFLQHDPLYTAGRSAKARDLLDGSKFPVFETKRGGQYTYHGPGQRIVYMVIDLKKRAKDNAIDIREFVQSLEQWIINVIARFGIKGEVKQGRVGIWVEHDNKESKIAAIGLRVSKNIVYHGIALNINPDLSHYSSIVPCGISEYGVTSLADLGITASIDEVDQVLQEEFVKMHG